MEHIQQEIRQCKRCGQEKPLGQFTVNRATCRVCYNQEKQARRAQARAVRREEVATQG